MVTLYLSSLNDARIITMTSDPAGTGRICDVAMRRIYPPHVLGEILANGPWVRAPDDIDALDARGFEVIHDDNE